eukprot:TRINITY_DN67919_c0_g1_i1.p1 TRINITY_DN67919_c0_g1~~TRINITY_DN67919_c0_g1_i1.p1  ORF type:complete len:110 (-),score=1.58 TRINITY_DN67919_c0_g1_i1:127-408(-)
MYRLYYYLQKKYFIFIINIPNKLNNHLNIKNKNENKGIFFFLEFCILKNIWMKSNNCNSDTIFSQQIKQNQTCQTQNCLKTAETCATCTCKKT